MPLRVIIQDRLLSGLPPEYVGHFVGNGMSPLQSVVVMNAGRLRSRIVGLLITVRPIAPPYPFLRFNMLISFCWIFTARMGEATDDTAGAIVGANYCFHTGRIVQSRYSYDSYVRIFLL